MTSEQPRKHLRRQSFSLRTRVAGAAAAGAVIIVTIAAFVGFQAIERNNVTQTDQQLEIASRIVLIEPVLATGFVNLTGLQNTMALTVRDDGQVTASSSTQLPDLPPGSQTVELHGQPYRVLTTTENQPAGRTV
jgi:two-component system sensor histidine kinase PrrB